jgi:hypothetical protein
MPTRWVGNLQVKLHVQALIYFAVNCRLDDAVTFLREEATMVTIVLLAGFA